MGCGRTDAGVHASSYYFHVDLPDNAEEIDIIYKLNRMCGKDIVFYNMQLVDDKAHTRFDAILRSYTYYIDLNKNPFGHSYNYYTGELDLKRLNEAANLLLEFEDFFPFCKSNSDVNNYKCQISRSEWIQISNTKYEFHISANRFLRGMVRLVVGMCLSYIENRITLEEVRTALEKQNRLPRDFSVPGDGLFLTDVKYSYI